MAGEGTRWAETGRCELLRLKQNGVGPAQDPLKGINMFDGSQESRVLSFYQPSGTVIHLFGVSSSCQANSFCKSYQEIMSACISCQGSGISGEGACAICQGSGKCVIFHLSPQQGMTSAVFQGTLTLPSFHASCTRLLFPTLAGFGGWIGVGGICEFMWVAGEVYQCRMQFEDHGYCTITTPKIFLLI